MDRYVAALATFAGTFGVLGSAWVAYVRHARKNAQTIGVLGPEKVRTNGSSKPTTLSMICLGAAFFGTALGADLATAGLQHNYWEHRVQSISASTPDDLCRQVQEMYDSLPTFLETGREVVGQHRCPTVAYNFDQYRTQNQ